MDGNQILKLGLLFMVNLGALGYLVFSCMKLGSTYQQSLRTAWDLVITGLISNYDYSNIHPQIKWFNLIRRTWWLMLFLTCLVWVTTGGYASIFFIVFWLLFHGYWYWQARSGSSRTGEQILFARDNWGVIYREVDLDSGFDQKSLAELDLRKKNLLVLAIERDGRMIAFPKGMEVMQPGDRVLLFGELRSYRTAGRELNSESF